MATSYTPAHSGEPNETHTSQRNPLLSIIKGEDGSEWIYLQGVASLAAKEAVIYDEAGQSVRLTHLSVGSVAVCGTVAIAATEFGYFCITSPRGGLAALSGGAVADNKALYVSSVTGTFDDAAVTGDFVVGAFSRSAPTGAGALTVQLDRPKVGGILG